MDPHEVLASKQTHGEEGFSTGKRPPISSRHRRAPANRPKLPGRWFTHLLYIVNGLLLLAIILLSVVLMRAR